MATKTPVGRSIRRTHLCGAGPQAPLLHFRAPFKVRQGFPKPSYSCFSHKLGTLLPHSQSSQSGGPSTRSRCPAGGRTAIGGSKAIWTSGSQRGPTALRPRASALLSPGGRASGLVILGVRKRSSTPKSPPGGAVSLARIPLWLRALATPGVLKLASREDKRAVGKQSTTWNKFPLDCVFHH